MSTLPGGERKPYDLFSVSDFCLLKRVDFPYQG